MKNSKKYHPAFLIFIGLVSLLALYFSIKDISVILRGEAAQAVVTDSSRVTGSKLYLNKFSFVDDNDIEYVFTEERTVQRSYVSGQIVPIYYLSNNPNVVIVFSMSTSLIQPILALCALLWTVFMGWKLYSKNKK